MKNVAQSDKMTLSSHENDKFQSENANVFRLKFFRKFIHLITSEEKNITRKYRESFTSNTEFISAVVTLKLPPSQKLQ